jgi:hypothetical protein
MIGSSSLEVRILISYSLICFIYLLLLDLAGSAFDLNTGAMVSHWQTPLKESIFRNDPNVIYGLTKASITILDIRQKEGQSSGIFHFDPKNSSDLKTLFEVYDNTIYCVNTYIEIADIRNLTSSRITSIPAVSPCLFCILLCRKFS